MKLTGTVKSNFAGVNSRSLCVKQIGRLLVISEDTSQTILRREGLEVLQPGSEGGLNGRRELTILRSNVKRRIEVITSALNTGEDVEAGNSQSKSHFDSSNSLHKVCLVYRGHIMAAGFARNIQVP